MGDALVPYSASNALALLHNKDPLVSEEEQKKRLEEAQALEEKLKVIQEAVPTRVYNTSSSCAGAGSSDFHMYRMVRKAEQERWKRIEANAAEEEEKKAFELKRKQREAEAEAKTAKNRAKRQKKKAKKATKQGGTGDDQGDVASEEAVTEEPSIPDQADLD